MSLGLPELSLRTFRCCLGALRRRRRCGELRLGCFLGAPSLRETLREIRDIALRGLEALGTPQKAGLLVPGPSS